MARYSILHTHQSPGLDSVIEADTYRVDAKFFTFLQDKEVIRSLSVARVVQVKRLADDEEPPAEQVDEYEIVDGDDNG